MVEGEKGERSDFSCSIAVVEVVLTLDSPLYTPLFLPSPFDPSNSPPKTHYSPSDSKLKAPTWMGSKGSPRRDSPPWRNSKSCHLWRMVVMEKEKKGVLLSVAVVVGWIRSVEVGRMRRRGDCPLQWALTPLLQGTEEAVPVGLSHVVRRRSARWILPMRSVTTAAIKCARPIPRRLLSSLQAFGRGSVSNAAGSMNCQSLMNQRGVVEDVWLDIMSVAGRLPLNHKEKILASAGKLIRMAQLRSTSRNHPPLSISRSDKTMTISS